MELTQQMDCAFPRPSQRVSSNNKIGFLGIAGSTYPVVLGVNKVGRDPSCHVSLDNQTVSRQHAVVNAQSEREVLIMDMGSANGTKLENSVLAAYVPCPLRHGDVVQFGDVLGVFRSQGPPPTDEFPATQRCGPAAPAHRPPLRVPESPENSDLDDSLICLNKNTSVTFRNSSQKPELSNIPEVKNESVQDCSLFEAETQMPPPNRIFQANTEVGVNTNKVSRIFDADTQVPAKTADDSIFDAATQAPPKTANDSIFDAETQMDRSRNNSRIYEAETQFDPRPSDNSGIFCAETQVDTRPCGNSRIFVAESQYDRPSDKAAIHNAETQMPSQENSNGSIYEKNTQMPDERRDIHIADTQVWLGRSPHTASTPENYTPEENPEISLQKRNSDPNGIDGAETQMWPDDSPPIPSSGKPCSKDIDLDMAETQVLPEAQETEQKEEEIDFAETQVWPEPNMVSKTKKICPKPVDIQNVQINQEPGPSSKPVELTPDEPSVSPTLPSPSKRKARTSGSTKSESDQEISFNEMDCDDFMVCESQTVMETDFDEPLRQRREEEVRPINGDIEDLPTQVLPEREFNEPFKVASNVVKKFEATQFEDMATQVLPDEDDNADALTQIIPTIINLKKSEPQPFEDMLTQVIPEPDAEVKKIVFKVPHASPLKKKRSLNVTPINSPRKKIEELDENYYAATQDIMLELSEGRQVSTTAVVGLRRRSGSSQSCSGDSQSRSFNLSFDDLELPNSQEITRAVSPIQHIERPSLSTSQLSSESEDEPVQPEILHKAPPKKKVTKTVDMSSRRSARPRKPTAKFQEAEESYSDKDSDCLPSRKDRQPRARRIKEEKSHKSEMEKARRPRKEPVDACAELIKPVVDNTIAEAKEKKKSLENVSDRKKGLAKSIPESETSILVDLTSPDENQTKQNNSERKELQNEQKPRSSRRAKEEKKSPNVETEKPRSHKERHVKRSVEDDKSVDLTKDGTKTKDETKKSRSSGIKKELAKSDKPLPTKRTYERRRKKESTVAPSESCASKVDLTTPSLQTSERKRKKDQSTPTSELKTSIDPKKATSIPEVDASESDSHSLRRSKRLKPEDSENMENLNYSTAYDLDTTGQKRSHFEPDSKKHQIKAIDVDNYSSSRSKRARYETRNSRETGEVSEGHRVLLTSFPAAAVADVKRLLEGLGAKLVEDARECSVLVSPSLRRTVKLLCCVGRGRPVVGRRWLEACAAAGTLLDPWQYILRDESAERRYGCSLEATLRGARGFLRGRRVAATPAARPPPDDLRKIVECSGGTWCEPARDALCVSAEADRAQWARLRRRGADLVHVDYILTGVLRQQVDITKFRLK